MVTAFLWVGLLLSEMIEMKSTMGELTQKKRVHLNFKEIKIEYVWNTNTGREFLLLVTVAIAALTVVLLLTKTYQSSSYTI